MQLLLFVFAPMLTAILLSLLPRGWLARLAIVIPSTLFITLLIASHDLTAVELSWIPTLDVSLSFFVDGLGRLFALIITGIGALVLLYASGYFDQEADYVRFSTYTLMFMTAMLGVVLSGNLLMIFVFWEITSITSYLLIGFKHEKEEAREGARRAMLVTGAGGLAMLAGFLLIGITAQTFNLSEILASGDLLRESPLYPAMLLLVLAGAFTKSAQFPFHFWLPGAMEAPTPASTYLHSATMVKAGIFLIARLSPVLNNTDLWVTVVTGVGLLTFLYAAVIALRQTDLKAILAYSTVSWLGVLVAVQGIDTQYAAIALTVGVLGHALYKATMFLVAGNIDHATGTRIIDKLGRLARIMPFTFIGALIAGLSMAGIPPLLGFLSKETLKAASLYEGLPPVFAVLFPVAAVIGSALTVAVAFRIVWDTFFGSKDADTPHHPHEVGILLWIPLLTLGIFSIALPLFIAPLLDPLINDAVSAIRQQPASVHLHLFEGINTPLIMSVIAIALGIVIFAVRRPVIAWLQARPDFNPVVIYNFLLKKALPFTAEKVTDHLQSGKLHYYMRIVIGAFVAISILTIVMGNLNIINGHTLADLDLKVAFICVMLVIGAVSGILAPTRLSAVLVLGIEGALLSLLFALFGAPDLAFTQLMIEVISLTLFVLAFHFLPDTFLTTKRGRSRATDLVIATGAGITVTLLILVAQSNKVGESISQWYIDNAISIGQGHNVVNTIIVDFRGMDTQGEIAVLIIAAIGVTALLRLRPVGAERGRYITTAEEIETEEEIYAEVEEPETPEPEPESEEDDEDDEEGDQDDEEGESNNR